MKPSTRLFKPESLLNVFQYLPFSFHSVWSFAMGQSITISLRIVTIVYLQKPSGLGLSEKWAYRVNSQLFFFQIRNHLTMVLLESGLLSWFINSQLLNHWHSTQASGILVTMSTKWGKYQKVKWSGNFYKLRFAPWNGVWCLECQLAKGNHDVRKWGQFDFMVLMYRLLRLFWEPLLQPLSSVEMHLATSGNSSETSLPTVIEAMIFFSAADLRSWTR